MYKLVNSFTNYVISKHYTVGDAAKAARERMSKKRPINASLIALHCVGPDGQDVDDEEWLKLLSER